MLFEICDAGPNAYRVKYKPSEKHSLKVTVDGKVLADVRIADDKFKVRNASLEDSEKIDEKTSEYMDDIDGNKPDAQEIEQILSAGLRSTVSRVDFHLARCAFTLGPVLDGETMNIDAPDLDWEMYPHGDKFLIHCVGINNGSEYAHVAITVDGKDVQRGRFMVSMPSDSESGMFVVMDPSQRDKSKAKRHSLVEITTPTDYISPSDCPVLALINPESGPGGGREWMEWMQSLTNNCDHGKNCMKGDECDSKYTEAWNLSETLSGENEPSGLAKLVAWLNRRSNPRIVVGGGDGAISWVVGLLCKCFSGNPDAGTSRECSSGIPDAGTSHECSSGTRDAGTSHECSSGTRDAGMDIDSGAFPDYRLKRLPPIALLPLGTGNLFGGCTGWYNSHSGGNKENYLEWVRVGRPIAVDMWSIEYGKPMDSFRPQVMMCFMSFGYEAQICAGFEMARREKDMSWASKIVGLVGGTRAANKTEYFVQGTKSMFVSPNMKTNLSVMGSNCGSLEIEDGAISFDILNINRMGDNLDFWGESEDMKSFLNDGLLDVGVLANKAQFYSIMAKLANSQLTHLAQCNFLEITVNEPTFMQAEGEAWLAEKGDVITLKKIVNAPEIVLGPHRNDAFRSGIKDLPPKIMSRKSAECTPASFSR
eukprot:457931_1